MNENINIIVTRDDHIDEEYYDNLYIEQRRAAVRAAGHEAVVMSVNVAHKAARGLLYLLTPEPLRH
jgi:hypothetical protein